MTWEQLLSPGPVGVHRINDALSTPISRMIKNQDPFPSLGSGMFSNASSSVFSFHRNPHDMDTILNYGNGFPRS
jgi:hypothetical protein